MGKTIARGEITIVDLVDTATYIYYSENESGLGAATTPTATTKYIGIYNGPPAEGGQPGTPPTGTKWTKYVGEDGAPGEGVTVKEIKYEYAKSTTGQTPPITGWQSTVPSLSGGDYLWSRTTTIYSDKDSKPAVTYNVSYSGINGKDGKDGNDGIDGKDANTYYIETNQEEILRFKEGEDYLYSPEILTFKIYNNPKQNSDKQIEISEESYQLEYYKEGEFYEITDENILSLGFKQEVGDEIESQAQNSENEIVDPYTVYFFVSSFYETQSENVQNNQIFRFSYIINEEVAAIKIVQMRNGVSDDMAKLNLHATNIDASIQSGRLNFSANGLSLYKNEEQVFWADDDGNLHLKGILEAAGGKFTGTLEAAKGDFEGKITAKEGNIGGLAISDSALFSGKNIENSPLRIYGNGELYAQNITLGNNATIENFLKLGNAYIKNPEKNSDENDHTFIQAGKVSLTDDGYFNLGEIQLYGGDSDLKFSSYIKADSNGQDSFWQINGDGTAKFKEITVDKATIQNSILEINTIQAVGSLMLFKDSWKVQSVLNGKITLETSLDSINLKVNDFITNGTDYFKIVSVDGKTITVNGTLNPGENITKIGKSDDFLMTVLGDSTVERNYATKNSLTISKVKIPENSSFPSFQKVLVLGDLTGINKDYGTGLYAENVFLKGTLTTQTNSNNYAGINTLSKIKFDRFIEDEEREDASEEYNSNIVFWAGSKGFEENHIKSAPFQVTEAGSIYANKGHFKGSLITDSVIKGASIHTAEIFGEIDGQSAPLKIYDANKGIEFIKNRNGQEVQLGISNSGFYTGTDDNNYFINLVEGVSYIGQSAKYYNNDFTIFIQPGSIGFDKQKNSTAPSWKINYLGSKDKGFSFSQSSTQDSPIFEINPQNVRSLQKVNFEQGIVFGKEGDSGRMEYQKTAEGYYNLYVR